MQPFATSPQQRAETCAVNGCIRLPEIWAAVSGHFTEHDNELDINCWLCAIHYKELDQ